MSDYDKATVHELVETLVSYGCGGMWTDDPEVDIIEASLRRAVIREVAGVSHGSRDVTELP